MARWVVLLATVVVVLELASFVPAPGGSRESIGHSISFHPDAAAPAGDSRGRFGAGTSAGIPGGEEPRSNSTPEWVNITEGVAGAPSPRSNASEVWDAADGYVLLFGGEGPNGKPLNDTWTFGGGRWTQITSSAKSPTPRFGAGMTYDATAGYVVLFSGETSASPVIPVNGTWEYRAGNWTLLGGLPSARGFPGMAYDPAVGGVVMAGGFGFTSNATHPSRLTWLLRAGIWSSLPLSASIGGPSGGPQGAVAGSMVWDNGTAQLLFFEGTIPKSSPLVYLNTTWGFNWDASNESASNWSNLTGPVGPSPRFDVALGYSSSVNTLVLFGGASGVASPFGDTWFWNGTRWSEFGSSGTGPSPRLGAAFAPSPTVDGPPAPDQLALFGGWAPGSGTEGDTWLFGAFPLSVGVPVANPNSTDAGYPTNLTILAFGGTPGYNYTWAGLPAGCTSLDTPRLPCAGQAAGVFDVTVTVTDGSGGRAVSGVGIWTVTSPPSITSFTISPTPVAIRTTVTITVLTSGGAQPLSYNYTGLPVPCASTINTLSCSPRQLGTYHIRVTVTDADNVSVNKTGVMIVSLVSGGSSTLPEYVAEGLIILVAAVVGLWLVWRGLKQRRAGAAASQRPRSSPSSSPPAARKPPATGAPPPRNARPPQSPPPGAR